MSCPLQRAPPTQRTVALGPHARRRCPSGRPSSSTLAAPARAFRSRSAALQPLGVACSLATSAPLDRHTPRRSAMASRNWLMALAVLAAAAGAQGRGLLAAKGGMMPQKMMSGASDNAVFARGRATSGDAYLAACAPVPPRNALARATADDTRLLLRA